MTVTTTSGQQHHAHHDLLGRIDPDQLADRLRRKSAVLLGDDTATDLWQAIDGLECAADLSALIGVFDAAAAQRP